MSYKKLRKKSYPKTNSTKSVDYHTSSVKDVANVLIHNTINNLGAKNATVENSTTDNIGKSEYLHQLENLYRMGQYQDYLSASQQQLSDDIQSNQYIFYYWRGESYLQLGDYTSAKSQFETLVDKFPNDHRAIEGLIKIYKQGKNWDKVIELSCKFNDTNSDKWQGHWHLGTAYLNLGRFDIAKQQFELLISKFPDVVYGYQGMVNVLYRQEEWQELAILSRDLVKQFPNHYDFYYKYGVSLYKTKQFDKAIAFFNKLDERFSDNPKALLEVARIHLQHNEITEAIALLESLLVRFNDNTDVRCMLVNAYIHHNDVTKATEVLSKIAESDYTKREIWRAKVYRLQYGQGAFVARLEKLHKQYPDNPDFAFEFAQALTHY